MNLTWWKDRNKQLSDQRALKYREAYSMSENNLTSKSILQVEKQNIRKAGRKDFLPFQTLTKPCAKASLPNFSRHS